MATAALTLAVAGLTWATISLDPWLDAGTPPVLQLLNAVPVLATFAVFLGLTRRITASTVLTAAPFGLLFYINSQKLEVLEQPLLLTDFYLLPQLFSNIGLFVRYSHGAILLGAVLIVIFMVLASIRWEPRTFKALPWGVVTGLAGIVLLGVLGSEPANRLYANQGAMDKPWVSETSVRETGLVASLAAAAGANIVPRPRPNAAAADALRRQLSNTPTLTFPGSEIRPDIVLILSESFFDPGILNDIDRCEVLPLWCQLEQRGILGNMVVPTFGGNTTRTEFEILTGVPYYALDGQVYPYLSIVTRPTPSIAWWLNHMDYSTLAIHPHAANFWERNRALPLLGFERFIAEEDFSPYRRIGFYKSDRDLTDKILEKLEASSKSRRFIFAISMENHGPWVAHRPNMDADRLAEINVPDPLEGDAALALKQFLYHAQNAVEQLDRLHDFIQNRDRPSVVLFFGDHLPGLHKVFNQLGFVDGRSAVDQQVPYLLLSNFPIQAEWMPDYSHQLGYWLLEQAGLPLPPGYRELSAAWHTIHRSDDPEAAVDPAGLRAIQVELLHLLPEDWTDGE